MNRSKWIAASIVLAVLVCTVSAPFALRYYVAAQVVTNLEQLFEGGFEAEQAQLASGSLSWTGCTIASPESSETVSADKVEYVYEWGWVPWNMHGELVVEGVRFDFDQLNQGSSLKSVRERLPKENQAITVRSAQIQRRGKRFIVDGHISGAKGGAGQLSVSYEGHPGTLIISADKLAVQGQVECVVDGFDLAAFGAIFDSSRVELQQGQVTGRIVATLPTHGVPYIEGSLQVSDASILDTETQLTLNVPKGECVISEVRENRLANGRFPSLLDLRLLEKGRLTFADQEQSDWQVNELLGSIEVFADGSASIEVEGVCLNGSERADLRIDGSASFALPGVPLLDLTLTLSAQTRPTVNIRMIGHRSATDLERWELRFKNLSRSEYEVLRTLASVMGPDLYDVEFRQGAIDGALILEKNRGELSSLQLVEMKATFFDCFLPELGLALQADYAGGGFSIDLSSPSRFRSVRSDLTLLNGQMDWDLSEGKHLHLQNLKARAQVDHGVVQKANVTGWFSGMEGLVEVDWENDADALQFDLKGTLEQMANWLPEKIGAKLRRVGPDDLCQLVGQISREGGELQLTGYADIASSSRKDRFDFGATVDLASPDLWGRQELHSPESAAEVQEVMQLTEALFPSPLLPSVRLVQESLDRSYGFMGVILKDGWVRAGEIPIARYIQPFIFDDDEQALRGICQFEARFCNHEWVYQYSGRQFKLDSSLVLVELDKTGDVEDHIQGTVYPGYQYFNLRDQWEFGFLPIQGAKVLDRTSGLQFGSVDALAVFGDKRFHALDLSSYVKNVFISGQVDVFGKPEQKNWLDVLIRTHRVSGSIPEVQQLLQNVDPSFTSVIPLEGLVTSGFHQGRLYVKRRQKEVSVEAYVAGQISGGHASSENGLVSLQGLGAGFAYDLERNQLTFDELSGQVLVGPNDTADQYQLSSRYVRLKDFPHCLAEFDVRLEDTSRDVIRLEGKGQVERFEGIGEVVRLNLFHETTHLGAMRPNLSELLIHGWDRVLALRAQPEMDLVYLSSDLMRLANTGWVGLSQAEARGLQELALAGQLEGTVFFDRQDKVFRFSLKGQEVESKQKRFERFLLSGSKQGDRWVVDQWELDDLMLSCDALKTEQGWKVDFLGARYGNFLTLGCEGTYRSKEREFNGKINLLDINFDDSNGLPSWLRLHELWEVQGKMRATGSLNGVLPSGNRPHRLQVALDALSDSLRIGKFEIEDDQPIHCYYDSANGITLSGFKALLGGKEGLECVVERLRYEPVAEKLSIQDVQFSVDSHELDRITSALMDQFAPHVDSSIVERMQRLKQEGRLQGRLDIEMDPSDHQVKVMLADGTYLFGGKEHELRDFIVHHYKYGSKASGVYRWQEEELDFEVSFDTGGWDTGTVVIGEELNVQWSKRGEQGFLIHRMQGRLRGLDLDLTLADFDEESGTYTLTGQMGVDASESVGLFPPSIRRFFKDWQIGRGWLLSGRFQMSVEDLSQLHFVGALSGSEFQIKGYTFEHLYADLSFGPDYLVLTDVKGLDRAGEGRIDSLDMRKREDGEWSIRVPLVLVTDLEVGQLRSDQGLPYADKSLVIERVEVRDLVGDPSDRTSFTGGGALHFVNPSRLKQSNTLLSIPKDLLARIGLSPDVLAPVRGSLYGQIRDGKVVISEFRDVFSEGRISRFYLPSDYEAQVSFDGELDLQVRMKQYNLIFKLAELFTITVKGDLANPTYTVQKQPDDAEEGV